MPIALPKLNDLTFDDLVEEARALIPALSPEWTDHNPSDPGITLVELFAWISEMLIYRCDQITPEHQRTFLRLLNGPELPQSLPSNNTNDQEALSQEIASTVLRLREQYRTVTIEDYEKISLASFNNIARTKCVARLDLSGDSEETRQRVAPGHVSVMVLPAQSFDYILPAIDNRALFSETDDVFYLGLVEQPFDGLQLELSQEGQGYQIQYEYYDGSAWVLIPSLSMADLLDTTFNWQREGVVWFGGVPGWEQSLPTEVSALLPEGESANEAYWLRVSNVASRAASLPNTMIADIYPRLLQPSSALIDSLEDFLEPRRLLTTRNHVVGPIYTPVDAEIVLAAREDAVSETLRQEILRELNLYLDPLLGGGEGLGWPFGRSIFKSELYAQLESLPGVDYVGHVNLLSSSSSSRPREVDAQPFWHEDGEMIGLNIHTHQLPLAKFDGAKISIASSLVPLTIEISGLTVANDDTDVTSLRVIKQLIREHFNPLTAGPSFNWQDGSWRVDDGEIATILDAAFSGAGLVDNMQIDFFGPTVEDDATREHNYIARFDAEQLVDLRIIANDFIFN